MSRVQRIFLFTLFSTAFITVHGQIRKDSVAIRQLLEKESATWRSGDIKGHADCWHIQPYSRILVSNRDTTFDVPPGIMMNPPVNMMGHGGFSVNSNYKMSISGKNAWVSHNEESTSADGKKVYSYEFRILEKIKGNWKLVGQSIHTYKPKIISN
ncbi:MAG: hypothetical protein ABJA57_11825 [Ginsengibacter sp.]